MKIPNNFHSKIQEDDNKSIIDLLDRIKIGKALLFVGAGFSTDTKNIYGEEPPRATKLAQQIAKLGKFNSDDDLEYASDYYISNYDKGVLVDFLKKTFTITDVSNHHKTICNLDWKRIYTTNYDNCIELAASKNKKLIESITLTDNTSEYYKKPNICVHLNGSINSLDTESLEESFKLSSSSYISPESFVTSQWYYPFKKDLERCSAIIFVGYSLYDIEIKKILFGNSDFAKKTFFITQENPSNSSVYKLGKFGKVLSIGVDGFANELKTIENEFLDINESWTEAFVPYVLSDNDKEMRDQMVSDFILHGNLDPTFIDSAVLGTQIIPYLIKRDDINKAIELSKNNKHIVIFSDFGNGKTIFLRELMSSLSVSGKRFYC